jgi:hypothetical protein
MISRNNDAFDQSSWLEPDLDWPAGGRRFEFHSRRAKTRGLHDQHSSSALTHEYKLATVIRSCSQHAGACFELDRCLCDRSAGRIRDHARDPDLFLLTVRYRTSKKNQTDARL